MQIYKRTGVGILYPTLILSSPYPYSFGAKIWIPAPPQVKPGVVPKGFGALGLGVWNPSALLH